MQLKTQDHTQKWAQTNTKVTFVFMVVYIYIEGGTYSSFMISLKPLVCLSFNSCFTLLNKA